MPYTYISSGIRQKTTKMAYLDQMRRVCGAAVWFTGRMIEHYWLRNRLGEFPSQMPENVYLVKFTR